MTITNSAYAPLSALPLMIWLSPAFPIGSFAYSHALEWASENGDLPNATALEDWLNALLRHGAPRNDAILLAESWRAAQAADAKRLRQVNNLALALAGGRERYIETTAQGNAFLLAIGRAWNTKRLGQMAADLAPDVAYPVAVGLAAASHDIDLGATLDAYLTALISNLTSVAIRLGVLGQTQAQAILVAALHVIRELAEEAANATLNDVGSCAFRSDIAAIRHETQCTRLFRT